MEFPPFCCANSTSRSENVTTVKELNTARQNFKPGLSILWLANFASSTMARHEMNAKPSRDC